MSHERALQAADQPGRKAGSLRTVAVTIYATFIMLAIAIPQGLVNWLRDMKGSEVQELLLDGAEALQRASQHTGIAIPYVRARAIFFDLTGKEDN